MKKKKILKSTKHNMKNRIQKLQYVLKIWEYGKWEIKLEIELV